MSNTQKVNCFIPVSYLEDCKGDVSLLPNEYYSLVIDYPFDKPMKILISSGENGMGLAPLLREIGKAYKMAYAFQDQYGIWGHGMGDLMLESINVDHVKKLITLGVGS